MTKEEAIKILPNMKGAGSEWDEAIDLAISALKAQMDGDIISRQDAIDAVEKSRHLNHHQDGKEACAHEYEHRHFLKILRDLPPVQSELSDVARSIATIIENEQDMRAILKNTQNDIIHCEDCRFRHKSPDWKHRQSFRESIWYCEKGRGLNFAETVELNDYCSSAKRRTE